MKTLKQTWIRYPGEPYPKHYFRPIGYTFFFPFFHLTIMWPLWITKRLIGLDEKTYRAEREGRRGLFGI